MIRNIGICRALDGYRFLNQWQIFLSRLGFEVVVSDPTNRAMVEAGARIAPAELCLPAKVYLGHALSLEQKVDALFVPRMVCRREGGELFFGCPKAMALPDMVRALLPQLRLVEFVLDERERSEAESYRQLAKELTGENRIDYAVEPEEEELREEQGCFRGASRGVRIGIVGHDYLVEDQVLSLGLIEKLRQLGVEPVRSLGKRVRGGAARRKLCPAFVPNWMFEKELIDSAMILAEEMSVSGLILATSFACGTSAVTNEIIRRAIERGRPDMPVLNIVFDEHAAEAGFWTRLESFVELLQLRRTRAGAGAVSGDLFSSERVVYGLSYASQLKKQQ